MAVFLLLWLANLFLVVSIALYKQRDGILWGTLAFMVGPMALWIVICVEHNMPYTFGPSPYRQAKFAKKTKADNVSRIAYKASIRAGNPVEVAEQDGKAAKLRYNAQEKIRRRYNTHEAEPTEKV